MPKDSELTEADLKKMSQRELLDLYKRSSLGDPLRNRALAHLTQETMRAYLEGL
jgi:hypothetical protein